MPPRWNCVHKKKYWKDYYIFSFSESSAGMIKSRDIYEILTLLSSWENEIKLKWYQNWYLRHPSVKAPGLNTVVLGVQ